VAENGFIAVEKVKSKAKDYYDAVILDINMPILNGFDACS